MERSVSMKPGTRVHVHSKDMQEDLGEGSFICQTADGTPEFLLDSGGVVRGRLYWWYVIEPSKQVSA